MVAKTLMETHPEFQIEIVHCQEWLQSDEQAELLHQSVQWLRLVQCPAHYGRY